MAALRRIRLSPWLIALMAAGWLLEDGFPIRMTVSLVGVLMHETGHALCAYLLGCPVERIELTPFGGVAHVAGLEQLSAAGRVCVALAGPAISGFLVLLCGCGAYLFANLAHIWAEGMQINAALAVFNVLPAYPMDGGRVLCALLERKNGITGAQRFTAVLGMVLGVVSAVLGAAAFFFVGKINITLLLCGGYLYAEAWRAYKDAPITYLNLMLGRESALRRREILPVRILAVRRGTPSARIYAKMRPGALYRIVYLDNDLHVCEEKWETEL